MNTTYGETELGQTIASTRHFPTSSRDIGTRFKSGANARGCERFCTA